LPYLGFQCLDHPLYSPYLAPSHCHLFRGLKKTIGISPFFVGHKGHRCRPDLVVQIIFWKFVSSLQKIEQRARKCIELRGECVEYIPSCVVVAYFLSIRANYLSAPPLICI
jgi:hypothetical protein